MYNISLVDQAPKFIKEEFQGLWSNYINPLQNDLKDSDAEEFFINKTDMLNRAWNLFHVRLEKRGYKISKKNSTLIKFTFPVSVPLRSVFIGALCG